jgi:hypothetical protein
MLILACLFLVSSASAKSAPTTINLQVTNEMGTCPCDLANNNTYEGSFKMTEGSSHLNPAGGITKFVFTPDESGGIDVQLGFSPDGGCSETGTETLEILGGTTAVPTSNVTSSHTWNFPGCTMRGGGSTVYYVITFCSPDDKRSMCLSDGTCLLWPK